MSVEFAPSGDCPYQPNCDFLRKCYLASLLKKETRYRKKYGMQPDGDPNFDRVINEAKRCSSPQAEEAVQKAKEFLGKISPDSMRLFNTDYTTNG